MENSELRNRNEMMPYFEHNLSDTSVNDCVFCRGGVRRCLWWVVLGLMMCDWLFAITHFEERPGLKGGIFVVHMGVFVKFLMYFPGF